MELLDYIDLIPNGYLVAAFVVLGILAIIPHIAPHTKNPYDDKVAKVLEEYGVAQGIKAALWAIFQRLAGNYKNAQNK